MSRKAKTLRSYLFVQMKDRAFFDAWMDEPCPKSKDLTKALQLLAKERDEFGDKECRLLTKVRHVTELLELEKMESYAWKGKAEALAEACDYFLDHSVPPFTTDKWRLENRLVIGKALAAFKDPPCPK